MPRLSSFEEYDSTGDRPLLLGFERLRDRKSEVSRRRTALVRRLFEREARIVKPGADATRFKRQFAPMEKRSAEKRSYTMQRFEFIMMFYYKKRIQKLRSYA